MQLADVLGSLFALELISPSPIIYLVSPWISDIQLLHNHFGRYRSLMPDSTRDILMLADILNELADRYHPANASGHVTVRVIYRPGTVGIHSFLARLSLQVERRAASDLHEKGLLTSRCYLRGSMNFTFSGVNLNDERVELTTDPGDIGQAHLNMQDLWERAL